MRRARRAIAAGGAALAVATGVVIHRLGYSGAGRDVVGVRGSGASHGDAAAVTASVPGSPAPRVRLPGDPGTPTARTAALRARLGGSASASSAGPGAEPAVLRALATFSAAELGAFARFERLTGRPAPPALLELLQLRRAGADEEELAGAARRLFAGDPLGRAAALDGLRDDPR